MSKDKKKFAHAILKTGFVLECKIGDLLRSAGWTVISNKYYEDDFEGSVREIDLLAYKASEIQGIAVYTTLLISCKKSEANVWALLARPINLKDPNTDWWPLHAWSNNKAISFVLSKSGTAKYYHEEMKQRGINEALSIPACEVFAFQEMNRESGAPQNDKNIFAALTSLMKAQAYELGALSQRKTQPSIYQFNLISVVESDLIRLKFENDTISEEEIDTEHYISRYIIKRSEISSRIRFINANSFAEKLDDYQRLHTENCSWFGKELDRFYGNIFTDTERINVFIDEFRSKLRWPLLWGSKNDSGKKIDSKNMTLEWDQANNRVEIIIAADFDEKLNEEKFVKKAAASALKDIYRYSGDFIFTDNLTF